MSGFNLEKFRTVFLKSDGWQVSDCYKTYDDKFLRKDAQDAYEGAKWAWQEQQAKIDLLEKEIVETQEFLNKQNYIKQTKIDELKHQKSLQELAINQISQANQEWRSINYEQQKRIGALSKRLNEAISIVVDDLEEFMRGEK